ncbi:MAG TPA: YiiX/YebB-like N1pC/P60 family cysteine hydrolase [Archangium sp.]|uniref:YiiX/YebB-like N1pC/P60 family cysteine hydrolase n=1 Tax=Archangium sp. TaxID=1872627 RepID=UPI002E2FA746|nr:YiiX/YebB-like N1pC/P60 family cysteine hydrolase [Archangium sp.]HEX5753485.1 YiiX/YebB-like N1pC/P60 family cysteine hydrolase [Archangium sp.]
MLLTPLLVTWLALTPPPAAPPPAPQAPAAPSSDSDATSVYSLDDGAFVDQALKDLEALERHARGLRALQEQIAKTRGLYTRKQDIPYTPDEKRTLLTTWAAFSDYFASLELIRQRYWDFVKQPSPTRPAKHAWGFLLTHGALTTQLAHGLTYAELTGGRKQLEVLLDEPSEEYGLPARTFARFKEKAIHVSTTTQLMTGDTYAGQLRPLLKKTGILNVRRAVWLLQEMRLNSQAARGKLLERGPTLFAKAGADVLKDFTASAVFPVQRSVAEWMGDTRVKRIGQPLIRREQALALLAHMQPGDILVARQNWYLSNIGLPGFWPHAELYVGTPQDWATFLDGDPGVRDWLKTLPGAPQTLAQHLAREYPARWASYTAPDGHGDAIRIIESISEGVSFTGPEHGMHVDYLGVLRPRLAPVEKARAIARAFHLQGRPYDFNFDFFSDSTLVCTELVYKSYAPSQDMRGVRIGLVDVAGRRTLPANEIVRLFDSEYGQPGQQLDFVAFLDGREQERDAVQGDIESFRRTWRRVKWDIAQQ